VNGVAYEVDVQAQGVGLDATASQIVALADSLDATSKVATVFDSAIGAAQAQLAQASLAAASAAAALTGAESKYAALEREATKAAKAVERMAMKGGDTSALQSQAQAAAAAVSQQAAAVDRARAAATAAAGAETKLAGSLRTLEGAAKKAAVAQEAAGAAGQRGFTQSSQALDQLVQQASPASGQFLQMARSLGNAGVAGAVVMAVLAIAALGVALAGAAVSAMKFAIANDKVASARLTEISKRWKENIKGLFSGIDTKPLLNALDKLVAQFSASSAAGHALKTLIETIMNPLIRAIEWLTPYAHELWNGMVYGALQVAIAVVSARNAILRVIPESVKGAIRDLIAGFDGLGAAFTVGKIIIGAVAVVLGVVAVAFLALAAAIVIPLKVIWDCIQTIGTLASKFWEAAVGTGQAIAALAAWVWGGLSGAIDAVTDFVASCWDALTGWAGDAVDAAANFVQGIVDGIKAGVGAVADAASDLAQSALDAVTSSLGIASRSKVMFAMGGYTAEGMAEGVDEGAVDVQSSIEHMVGLADIDAKSPTMRGGSSQSTTSSTTTSRGGNTYHVTINAPTGDGEDIRSTIEAWFQSTLDAEALEVGA
jgi:phage-related protein